MIQWIGPFLQDFEGVSTMKLNEKDELKAYSLMTKPFMQLSNFGKIFKIIKRVADILSGKNPLTECEVLSILLPPIFSFGSLIENLLPDCVEVIYVE